MILLTHHHLIIHTLGLQETLLFLGPYFTLQVLSSIAVCISYFILSGIFGFPTIALPALLKNQTESNDTSFLDQTVFLSEDEGSIFVYIYCLIGMVMCTIGGILSGKYGRKTIISISAPCIGLGWLLIGLAQEKIILFLGRIIVSTFGLLYTSSAGQCLGFIFELWTKHYCLELFPMILMRSKVPH